MGPIRVLALVLVALLVRAGDARAEAPDAVEPAGQAAEVRGLEAGRAEVEAKRAKLDEAGRAEASEIARLKAQAPGIARDLRLGELLASAQARGRELERLAADLRARDALLVEKWRALLDSCGRALESPKLDPARRESLGRVAAETVEKLRAAGAAQGPLAVAPARAIDPLAGPEELLSRADRLKDDEEKLRREAARLSKRIAALDEKRRLRESAAAVDDDLFNEASVGRAARRPLVSGANAETASDRGAPAAGGAFGGSGGPQQPGGPGGPVPPAAPPSTMLRGVVDPSTLGELRRAEAGGDPELEMQALRHAQRDLAVRAAELARREAEMRKRATELRNRK